MPLVNFSNLDFDQIKASIQDYLRANSNFTDYDFEGSNLSTIIDTLAYNTYITSYNANMVTNEVFIDSATLRENVVSLARNVGYLPRSRKAAGATISFFIDTSNITPVPSTITLKKGIVATSQGSFGRQSYTFCILEDITVPVADNIASFDDIFVYEIIKSKVDIKQRSKDSQLYRLPDTKYCDISVTWDGSELCFSPSKEVIENANVDEKQNVTVAGKTHHPFFITYENRPDFIIQTVSIPFSKLLSSETRVKFEYNKYSISLYTQKYLETYSFRRT